MYVPEQSRLEVAGSKGTSESIGCSVDPALGQLSSAVLQLSNYKLEQNGCKYDICASSALDSKGNLYMDSP